MFRRFREGSRSVPWRGCAALVWLVAAGGCAGPPRTLDDAPAQPDAPLAAPPALALAPPAPQPAPRDGHAWSLAELLELAEQRNPALAAARARLGAAAGRRQQAGLWSNPRLELAAEDIPGHDFDFGEAKSTLALEQPFDVSGRRGAARRVEEAAERAAARAVESARRELHGRVATVWLELQHLHAVQAELERAIAEAATSAELAQRRVEARVAPEAEFLRASIELDRLRLEHAARSGEVAPRLQELAALLGGAELAPERLGEGARPALPELERAPLRAAVLAENPELLEGREWIQVADGRVELAGAERWSELGVRAAWGRIGASGESIVELGVSLPLPLWDRGRGRLLEARQLAVAARLDEERRRDELLARLESDLAGYEAGRRAVAWHDERLLPAAERAAAQIAERYRAGSASLLELIDAQGTLAALRLDRLAARRQGVLALVRLWTLAAIAAPLPTLLEADA